MSYFSATTLAYSASATAPVTMSLTLVPEANSAPPVDAWMIPSLPASANLARSGPSWGEATVTLTPGCSER